MVKIVAIEKQVQVVEDVNEVVVTIVEREATVIEAIPVFAIYNSNGQISTVPLTIEHDGQTQFNIFGSATHHVLLINGVEYHTYSLQQIAGNWKLVWTGDFALQTTDELIFRVFNT